jgi:hypothetical protein
VRVATINFACTILLSVMYVDTFAFQKCHWAREKRRVDCGTPHAVEQEIRHVGEQIILYTPMPRARVLTTYFLLSNPNFLPNEQTDEYLVCIQSKREGEEINTLLQ